MDKLATIALVFLISMIAVSVTTLTIMVSNGDFSLPTPTPSPTPTIKPTPTATPVPTPSFKETTNQYLADNGLNVLQTSTRSSWGIKCNTIEDFVSFAKGQDIKTVFLYEGRLTLHESGYLRHWWRWFFIVDGQQYHFDYQYYYGW